MQDLDGQTHKYKSYLVLFFYLEFEMLVYKPLEWKSSAISKKGILFVFVFKGK